MKKSHNELHNLWSGDYLKCTGCGGWIWSTRIFPPFTFKFKEVDRAYYKHVKECFALKRLIINFRNGKNRNKTAKGISGSFS